MNKIFSKLKNEKGQALVEFALVALIFFLILFAITEFGWAWYRLDVLKNAANTAARTYAVATGDKETAGETAADTVEAGMGDKVEFTCKDASGTTIACTLAPASVTATVSETFKTVVSDFPVLGQALGGTDGITLSRDATYRMEE